MARGSEEGRRASLPGSGLLARLRGTPSLPTRGGSQAAPRVRFTKQEAQRLNERFALLDRSERRAIMRAVNRGVPMQRRKDAELAIGVARRQQRFWSRAWLLGPAIALVQALVTPIGWLEGLLLAAWGTVLLGMMAAWWWTRARRAELENLQVVGGRGASGDAGGAARRSRLPGGPASTAEPAGTDGGAEATAAGPTVRPPRPRGRKRR